MYQAINTLLNTNSSKLSAVDRLQMWFDFNRGYNGLVDFKISLNDNINNHSNENVAKAVLSALDNEARGNYSLLTHTR